MTCFLRSFQFANGRVGVLHRDGRQPGIMLRIAVHQFTDVVVEKCRNRLCMVQRSVVVKHHRNGAHDLDLGVQGRIFPLSDLSIPTVLTNLPKKLRPLHHARESIPGTGFQVNVFTASEPFGPAGHFTGQDVRMAIDSEHGMR